MNMFHNNNITSQYTHDVVLTSVRRRFNVMNVVWMSKRCRVLTGITTIWFFVFIVHKKSLHIEIENTHLPER